MNKALTYGLVLLAASTAPRTALAASATDSTGALFFMSGPGTGPIHGAQGYLGVDIRDVTEDQAATLKLREPRGAEIVLVDHDAPAGKAGLREHDVVLQMNGQSIQGQDQLRRMLHDAAPGKTIVLIISRDGQQLTVTTQMAANREEVERQAWEQHLTVPEPQAPPEIAPSDFSTGNSATPPIRGNSFIGTLLMSPSYTGAMLEKMSSQLAAYFGVSGSTGLLVRSVEDKSPAALAGMHAGDVVVRADAHPVTSTADWAKAIRNSHGHSLSITVLRDKREQTLTLTPDSKKRSSLDNPDSPDSTDSVSLAPLGLTLRPRS
jgi:S1-C subfamily serine protease